MFFHYLRNSILFRHEINDFVKILLNFMMHPISNLSVRKDRNWHQLIRRIHRARTVNARHGMRLEKARKYEREPSKYLRKRSLKCSFIRALRSNILNSSVALRTREHDTIKLWLNKVYQLCLFTLRHASTYINNSS